MGAWRQGCISYSMLVGSQNSLHPHFRNNPYPNLGQGQSVSSQSSRQDTYRSMPSSTHPAPVSADTPRILRQLLSEQRLLVMIAS